MRRIARFAVHPCACCFIVAAAPYFQQGPKLVGIPQITGALQGFSVAISGDGNTAIIGAPKYHDSGGAFVFTRSSQQWLQSAVLTASSTAGISNQGASVAISQDGNTVLIGAPGDNNETGAVLVWTRSDQGWTQEAKLIAGGAIGPAGLGSSVALRWTGTRQRQEEATIIATLARFGFGQDRRCSGPNVPN